MNNSNKWRTIPGFIRVGRTGKTRGRHGEVKAYLEDRFIESVIDADFLFIEKDGNKVPLPIESIREVQDLLIKFAGIDDPGTAEAWASCPVYLPSDISEIENAIEEPHLEFENLTGFVINDRERGEIGRIAEVREYPQQEMGIVLYQEKEILIPLNEAFIIEIDSKKKVLHMDLPSGLLEI